MPPPTIPPPGKRGPTHFDAFGDITPIEGTALAPLYRYWEGLCDGRPMPRRVELDPIEMPLGLLPHLVLWDVGSEADGFRITVRLAGTAVEELYHRSIKGCLVEDLFPPEMVEKIRESTLQVIRRRLPRCGRIVERRNGEETLLSAGLSLPLSDDGERVDAVLVCVVTPLERYHHEDPNELTPLFGPPD